MKTCPSTAEYIDFKEFLEARNRICRTVCKTPLVFSKGISEVVGCEVWLKLESLQTTGSFKLRGASNRMLQLTSEERGRGVIAVSSGNHGRAVAYIAKKLGIRAIICVCELVPENKRKAIRDYGAELRVVGKNQDETQIYANSIIEKEGLTWIDPFDNLDVIAGQGTIALEIFEEKTDFDAIIAPLSGGGLLSGITLVTKTLAPSIDVIGASMENEPGMVLSLQEGRPVEVAEPESLADALGGSIGLDNKHTFPIIRDFMDKYQLVSEDDLGPAMRLLLDKEGLVMEGGSATAIAALLKDDFRKNNYRKVVVVVSGRNIASEKFIKAITS